MSGAMALPKGRLPLRPRTLVDVSGRNQEITLFGNKQKMPIAARAALKLLDSTRAAAEG